jgi:hypothetical protein
VGEINLSPEFPNKQIQRDEERREYASTTKKIGNEDSSLGAKTEQKIRKIISGTITSITKIIWKKFGTTAKKLGKTAGSNGKKIPEHISGIRASITKIIGKKFGSGSAVTGSGNRRIPGSLYQKNIPRGPRRKSEIFLRIFRT